MSADRVTRILKRDGSLAKFDREKVVTAIYKAAAKVGGIQANATAPAEFIHSRSFALASGERLRTVDLGLERIVLYSRRPQASGSGVEEVELLFENISGTSFTVRGRPPSE